MALLSVLFLDGRDVMRFSLCESGTGDGLLGRCLELSSVVFFVMRSLMMIVRRLTGCDDYTNVSELIRVQVGRRTFRAGRCASIRGPLLHHMKR